MQHAHIFTSKQNAHISTNSAVTAPARAKSRDIVILRCTM